MSMAEFTVQLAHSAIEDLNNIEEHIRGQVVDGIRSLSFDPLPTGKGIKKLKGFKPPLYRYRSGDFRIIYRLSNRLVMILRIINRKELEKIIKHSHL